MLLLLVLMTFKAIAFSQEEEEMEEMAESTISTNENNQRDINDMREKNLGKKRNINNIQADALEEMAILSPLQIQQFISYRRSFGNFISLMELQAVPGWDIHTIRKILPMLTLDKEQPLVPELKQRIDEGEQRILYRTGGQRNRLQTNTDSAKHLYKQLISYRFNFRDLLRWGITLEKDAGEKNIIDHYSMFASISKRGMLKHLILGDYTVSMGQGLVHWQGFAMGRSGNMMGSFRQGELFRPHTGTDENRFCRGMAAQFQKNAIEIGAFISKKKIDANTMTDSTNETKWVSTILLSGLHRTKNEMEDRKSLQQFIAGGNIRFSSRMGKSSFNMVHTAFDLPIKKRNQPYNRFAISGNHWQNASIDHSVSTTWGFLFAELAMDRLRQKAFLAGWIKSIDPKLDVSLLYRNMGMRYRALESNVFSENGEAGNEKGFFLNINYTPSPQHKMEIFCDRYQQDWPTFSTPGKRTGTLYSAQYTWRPNKKTEIYTRIQMENATHKIRVHAAFSPINSVVCRVRNELIGIRKNKETMDNGHLAYAELIIKPPMQAFSASIRCAWFDTDGYATRIYAYERDLPSYHAISPHHGTGVKTYAVVQYKWGRLLQLSGKWSMDEQRNDWRVQAIWQW